MRHTEIELDAFNGGSPSGYDAKYNLQLDAGVTYKEITIHGTNLNNDQLRRVSLSLNGDTLYDITGAILRMIQDYKSEHIEDGKWVIPFADFAMATQDGQNLTSLVTLPGENVVLQIETDKMTSSQQHHGDVASIRAEAILGVTQTARNWLPRLYSDVLNGSRAGENRYANFVNQNKSKNPVRIRRAHMQDEHIVNLEIKRNGRRLFDKSLTDQNYHLRRFGKQPQQGWYHFDPVKTDFGLVDPLNTLGETFEIITTKSKVGDFLTVFEVLEDLRTGA